MKPFRIVVIEDQSAELEKLSNALLLWKQQSTIAYSTEAFSSGELYLEQEDTEDFPDLFFLDIQLPGMDGACSVMPRIGRFFNAAAWTISVMVP